MGPVSPVRASQPNRRGRCAPIIHSRQRNAKLGYNVRARWGRRPLPGAGWNPGGKRTMNALQLPFTWRYIRLTMAIVATIAFGLLSLINLYFLIVFAVALFVAIVGIHDITQRRHSILRSYPLAARLRFLLEEVRPEIRQYFL